MCWGVQSGGLPLPVRIEGEKPQAECVEWPGDLYAAVEGVEALREHLREYASRGGTIACTDKEMQLLGNGVRDLLGLRFLGG